jgi:hypothetical protein
LEMNIILLGTIVLVIQMPGIVYVGVDSKVISIGKEISNVSPKQKLHQVGDVVFAHAGIFKDTSGKIDVDATTEASITAGGDLDQVVDRFTAAIEPQLSAVLPDIREQNPSYFMDKLKRPLEMLFVSARGGTPKVIVVFFELLDSSADRPAFRVTRLRCPSDCPEAGSTTIALGEHDAADQFLDSHPEALRTRGPAAAIQKAIAKQASATPALVSLPVVMAHIDRLGVHFLK